MKIKLTETFKNKLKSQVNYIAKDKPRAARKFKNDILGRIGKIQQMPYACRKSIFFEDENIRDLIYKGYLVVYRINKSKEQIEVFGFSKYEDSLKEKEI